MPIIYDLSKLLSGKLLSQAPPPQRKILGYAPTLTVPAVEMSSPHNGTEYKKYVHLNVLITHGFLRLISGQTDRQQGPANELSMSTGRVELSELFEPQKYARDDSSGYKEQIVL